MNHEYSTGYMFSRVIVFGGNSNRNINHGFNRYIKEEQAMITFLIGLFIGSFLGVILMAIARMGRDE